ncbi:hypothetical protein AVEN_30947-1, partial [Araneus ventricosus]
MITSGSGLPENFSHTTSNVGWVNTQLGRENPVTHPESSHPRTYGA